MRVMLSLTLLVALTACWAQASDNPTGGGDRDPVLVVADGPGGGAGITLADALTHGPTDDLVTVSGALFVDADGKVLLCDLIAESFPPQCGGDRIAVQGLDLADVPNLEEANGVRWSESVTIFGSVE